MGAKNVVWEVKGDIFYDLIMIAYKAKVDRYHPSYYTNNYVIFMVFPYNDKRSIYYGEMVLYPVLEDGIDILTTHL